MEEELGFEVGGVGPFPVVDGMQIYFDSTLAGAGRIYCGSGLNTRTVAMQFADLLAVSGGDLVEMTKA